MAVNRANRDNHAKLNKTRLKRRNRQEQLDPVAQQHADALINDGHFNGELMTCCLCDTQKQHKPGIKSDWTYVGNQPGKGFYFCGRCFELLFAILGTPLATQGINMIALGELSALTGARSLISVVNNPPPPSWWYCPQCEQQDSAVMRVEMRECTLTCNQCKHEWVKELPDANSQPSI